MSVVPLPAAPGRRSLVDADGVRRLEGVVRSPRCPDLVGVLRLVEVSRDAAGFLHRPVPFLSSRKVFSGVGSGRAQRWLAWSLALRLEDASAPAVILAGSCAPELVKRSVLQSVEMSLGVCLSGVRDVAAVRVVSTPNAVTAVCGEARGLLKGLFLLDPSHLSGMDLADLESASDAALNDLGLPPALGEVVAYTDGSYPHGKNHGPGGAAVVTSDGQWAARPAPDSRDSAFDCEAEAMVLAMEVTPPDVPLLLHSDCQSLVTLLNNVVDTRPLPHTGSVRGRLALALATRSASVRAAWVRGHNGTALNEAADRLAKLVSRHAAAGVDPEVTRDAAIYAVADEQAVAS